MASVHEYKRFENNLVHRIKNAFFALGRGLAGTFRKFGQFLARRYTVVFVPHSEKRVYNLHITVLSFVCFLLVTAGVLGAFIWFGTSYNSTRSSLAGKDTRLRDVQASLDQMR